MTSSDKSIGMRILPLFLGIIILFLLFRDIGFSDVSTIISDSNPIYIIISATILAFVIIIKILRWFILLEELNFSSCSKIFFVSQALNEIGPTGTGELSGVIIANKRYGVPKKKTIIATLTARYFDVVYLLSLSSLGFFLFFSDSIKSINLLFPLFIIVLAGFFIYKSSLFNPLISLIGKINNKYARIAVESFESLSDALVLFHKKSSRNQLLAILLTILAWYLDGIVHYFLLLSLGYELSLYKVVLIVSTSWLIGTFSFLPGGLGVRDFLYVLLLSGQGIPETVALSTIILDRILLYFYFSTGSIFSLYTTN